MHLLLNGLGPAPHTEPDELPGLAGIRCFCFSPCGQQQRDTTATGPYGLMRMRTVQGQNNNKSRPELAL